MGTSGARALVVDDGGKICGQGNAFLSDFGANIRDPENWWRAVGAALKQALGEVDRSLVVALAIDGTSGTVLAANGAGDPRGLALMYNDTIQDQQVLASIGRHAPPGSAVHGPTSALAKAIELQHRPGAEKILHQADWLALQFSGIAVSDENNTLKTGYDPVAGKWPNWISSTGMKLDFLPKAYAPGTSVGLITAKAARTFSLPKTVQVVTGTTDGCASFLATGAQHTGDAVTVLGTTITLKILCDRPVFAPENGIYSHKVLGKWLAGGASNSGGNVLLNYFSLEEIRALSAKMDLNDPVELNYYPLIKKGERFPINDPDLSPVVTPRPDDERRFLYALLDGMSRIEALGYQQIHNVGGPEVVSLRTVGGGATNDKWTYIRQKRLKVPFLPVMSSEAAYGVAILAKHGAR